MSWFNSFLRDNISKIIHVWIFVVYWVNEELKYSHPILTLLLSIFSLFVFHYIYLLEEDKSDLESKLISIKDKHIDKENKDTHIDKENKDIEQKHESDIIVLQ